MPLVVPACCTALAAMEAAEPTCRLISPIEPDSSSAALATLWTLLVV